MSKSKRELLFVAEGEGPGGEPASHWVYKSGRSYYVSGPNFTEHLCHPSVTSHEAIKREIFLVYQTKVTNVKMPWELNGSST
jgi:hypothetical protein